MLIINISAEVIPILNWLVPFAGAPYKGGLSLATEDFLEGYAPDSDPGGNQFLFRPVNMVWTRWCIDSRAASQGILQYPGL
jgi:hypothetical protein